MCSFLSDKCHVPPRPQLCRPCGRGPAVVVEAVAAAKRSPVAAGEEVVLLALRGRDETLEVSLLVLVYLL